MVFLSLFKNYKYVFDSCLEKSVFFLCWEIENIGSVYVRCFIWWRNICVIWVVFVKKNKVEEKGGLFRRKGFCYNFFVLYVNFEEELVLINMIFMILIKGFCFFVRLILKRRFY